LYALRTNFLHTFANPTDDKIIKRERVGEYHYRMLISLKSPKDTYYKYSYRKGVDVFRKLLRNNKEK